MVGGGNRLVLVPESCWLLWTAGITISQLLDRYLDEKNFELLFATDYISHTVMRAQARKTDGCASGRCLQDDISAWPCLPCAVIATGPLSCKVLGYWEIYPVNTL